jgi:D-mannonate dehydratase
MYTGRLISELMATVERAEFRAQLQAKQSVEQERMDEELHAIFSMQIPVTEGGQVFMGAA